MTVSVVARPASEQVGVFMCCLFEPNDLVEVRQLPSKHSTWHKASDLPSMAPQFLRANEAGESIYFSVNPRRAVGGRNAASVLLARCLFVDFDGIALSAAIQRIKDAGFPVPTLLIISGGGVHAYWRLKVAITDAGTWTRYQKGLAALLHSDSRVHDWPRVMRAPGFRNHKYDPPRNCEISDSDHERIYEIGEFQTAYDAGHQHARLIGRPVPGELVPAGARNQTLTQLAGAMRRQGATQATILTALQAQNEEACLPPLPPDEVAAIAKSVVRYAPKCTPAQWKPMPIHTFPEPLASFVNEGASALGCDPCMIAMPALTAIACAIGTTRRIRLKAQWAEPAILWTAVSSRSGSLKSPAYDLATAELRRSQLEKLKRFEIEYKQYQVAKEIHEKAKKTWRGSKSSEGPPREPTPPSLERHVVSDTTCEALGPILQANPRGVLLLRDELSGWLMGFNEYKRGKGRDVANWLEMHRAGTAIIDRKSSPLPIYVPRAAVSVAGTIQPSILRNCITPDYLASGLASRLLIVEPPPTRKQWSDREIPEHVDRAYCQAISRLFRLEHDIDKDDELQPVDLPLEPEAKSIWVKFFNEFADEQYHAPTDDLAAAFAKLEGYAPRLALIFQLVSWTNERALGNVIEAESMAAAIELTRWFVCETRRIYALWSECEGSSVEDRGLVEWIRARGGSVTARDVRRGPQRYRLIGAAETALENLVRSGIGTWEYGDGGEAGAPTRKFRLLAAGSGDETPVGAAENADSVAVASVARNEVGVWEG